MRLVQIIVIAIVLMSVSGNAQVYDDNGNVIRPTSVITPFGIPGTILHSFSTMAPTQISGTACIGTDVLVITDNYTITMHDEVTGLVTGTAPVDGSNDFGLGFDTKRNLYITTNATSDTLKVYDGISSTPVNEWPTPGAGPVGVAYDPTRDLYWVSDWKINSVYSMDPTTGASITTYSTSAFPCTRNAGVGFDAVNDEIIVGGRDQTVICVMDAATGMLKQSYAAITVTGNDPQGLACSPDLQVWHVQWTSDLCYKLDSGHIGAQLTTDTDTIFASTGGVVTFDLVAGQPYGNMKYLGMGSISGAAGIPLPGGGAIPLTWDIFTSLCIDLISSPVLVDFLGALNGSGSTTAKFNTLGPLPAATIGLKLYFAFTVKNKPWDYASNAVDITVK